MQAVGSQPVTYVKLITEKPSANFLAAHVSWLFDPRVFAAHQHRSWPLKELSHVDQIGAFPALVENVRSPTHGDVSLSVNQALEAVYRGSARLQRDG